MKFLLVGLCVLATAATALGNRGVITSSNGREGASDQCHRQDTLRRGWIIDIKTSMRNGAELLDGEPKDSVAECLAACCSRMECDMILYKNEGLSESGKNCYYVKCGADLDNCVLVEHLGFTSVLLEKSSGGLVDNPEEDVSSPEATPTTPPSSTEQSPTTQQGSNASENEDSVDQDNQALPENDDSNEEDKSSVSDVNENTIQDSSPEGEASENAQDGHNDNTFKNSERVIAEDSNRLPNENCGKYGCDGSGVIAVSVVGSICFAIIVVVTAVVLKRLVDVKKKRKFNNVDYLINGMYT